jgi:hypothetical protein
MTIASVNDWIASAKQYVSMVKTVSRPTSATFWMSLFDTAGNPGAGTLAGSSTAAGVVPTDATAGFPNINGFGGAGTNGYLAQVDFGNSAACRMKLFDCLFKAGAYAFNAAQALAGQPSYSARVLGGTDFGDTQIWIETVTGFTGSLSVAVTYTNQAGTTGRTTGTVATGITPGPRQMLQPPLQAGDNGVQRIESVTATVATAGTFNVLVLRPLWSGRVKIANDGDVHDLFKTGMPELFADSALLLAVCSDSSLTGIPELELVIASK